MDEQTIIRDIQNGELKKYLCPIIFCPQTSLLMIGNHEVTLKKAAAMKAAMTMLNLNLSKLELKKPFIIAYYESFGRGF